MVIAAAAREGFGRHRDVPPSFGGWLQPGAWAARRLIVPADIAVGRWSYTASRQRRHKARLAVVRVPGGAPMSAGGSPGAHPA